MYRVPQMRVAFGQGAIGPFLLWLSFDGNSLKDLRHQRQWI